MSNEQNKKSSVLKGTGYQRREMIELDSIIVHPNYNPGTGENYFMLMRFITNFESTRFHVLNFNSNIPNVFRTIEDKKVVALGWGMTRDGVKESASDVFRKATLEYENNYQCWVELRAYTHQGKYVM